MSLVSVVSKKVGSAAVCVAALLFTLVLATALGAQGVSPGDVVDIKSAAGKAAQNATFEPRSGSSHATIYYVPDHYGTIQAAVDAASSGDTIIVRADSYNNGPWAGPVYIAKSITLTSESGPAVTTIDGFRNGTTVELQTGADGELSGFTITNGYASTGGGIDVDGNATIKNNIITDNEVFDGHGGGISCSSGATIEDNVITDNRTSGSFGSGGGIHCANYGAPSIINNTISSNSARNSGGGVFCQGETSAFFEGNTISGNEAQDDGGGIYSHNSYATFEENLIELNLTDQNGGGACFYGDFLVTFTGNTVKDNTADYDGGGLYLRNADKNVIIEKNTIRSNTANSDGGGICCYSDSPTVIKNLIESNEAVYNGGGIMCIASSPEISMNTIRSNTAHDDGGGIYCDTSGEPLITSNFITENVADGHGGGIECQDSSTPRIINNTITLNSAAMFGGGIYCSAYPTITNTILWDNNCSFPEIYVSSGIATVTYCDVKGGWPGTGNKNVNPMFTDGLHLSVSSPCRDVGTNSSQWLPGKDIDGQIRVILSTVDIGADEFFVLFSPNWPGGLNTGKLALNPGYSYPPLFHDDGSTENLLGWSSGGDFCWLQLFGEPDGYGTIEEIHCIFGSAAYPGYSPGNGSPVEVYLWDDPTNDGDPSDCVLLTTQSGMVENVDTDIYSTIILSSPVDVDGQFFIGCCLSHQPGEYPGPMDETTPYVAGTSWFCGSNTQGGFDPNNLMFNQYPPQEMASVGFSAYWCLRAFGTYKVIDPMQVQRRK